jgi:hypothetical protein
MARRAFRGDEKCTNIFSRETTLVTQMYSVNFGNNIKIHIRELWYKHVAAVFILARIGSSGRLL